MPAKPDLPGSVSPGWQMKIYDTSAKPADVPGEPACWAARYEHGGGNDAGSAQIVICGYPTTGGAFEAEQRARAEADTVKFQEGKYFLLVKWTKADHQAVTTLVRAIQNTLDPKKK